MDPELSEAKAPLTAGDISSAEVHDLNEQSITQRLDGLIERFDAKIARDNAKEIAFDFLYQQLKEREDGYIDSIKRPLLRALLGLYDDLTSQLQRELGSEARESLEEMRSDLLDLLENEDVVRVDSSPVLDRTIHKVSSSLTSTDPAMHHSVARVLRHGFKLRDRLLRPEDVVVYLASQEVVPSGEIEETSMDPREGMQ